MSKAPEAFRTISEVAEGLDIPQHVLRFWETRFSQIRPLKRGGGRRYYRPSDIDLLSGIRKLLYGEGYTIRGVQRILRDQGVAHVTAIGRGEIGAEPEAATAAVSEGPATMPHRNSSPVVAEASPPGDQPGLVATSASVPDTPALSRRDIEELRLALTDLAAARRILERTE